MKIDMEEAVSKGQSLFLFSKRHVTYEHFFNSVYIIILYSKNLIFVCAMQCKTKTTSFSLKES